MMNIWSKLVNLDFILSCTKPSLFTFFFFGCIRVVPIRIFSRCGFQSRCHYCQMYESWNFRFLFVLCFDNVCFFTLARLAAFAATVLVFEKNQTYRNNNQKCTLFGRHQQSTCLTLCTTDCRVIRVGICWSASSGPRLSTIQDTCRSEKQNNFCLWTWGSIV